jgi:hypothetical protein
MEQGSNASALAARTAAMTDEQILDLDLAALNADDDGVRTPGTRATCGKPRRRRPDNRRLL